MAAEGKMRWVVMVFDQDKRRYVERQWFESEADARRFAKSLPTKTQWKILEY